MKEDAAQRERDAAKALAEKQAELEKAAKALEDKLKKRAEQLAAQGESAAAGRAGKAAEKTSEAGGEMGKSAQAGRQGDAQESEQRRGAAKKKLEEAREALRDPNLKDAERERLRAIRDEQKKIAEETKALEERMKNKDSTKSGAESVGRAQQKMQQAQGKLDQGETEPAIDEEKEAEKYLKMADERLAEEALYRIEKELDRVEAEQQQLLARTSELWAARGPEDSFSRAQRISGRKLAEDQDALAGSLDPVVKAIVEEESAVFGPILHGVKDDMSAASEKMRKLEPDEHCQGIERDILARIAELKQAFKDERERRRKQKPQAGQPGEPQNNGKPKIIDSVAELQALKLMQESVTRAIAEFEKEQLPKDAKELTRTQRLRLERLAHQQGAIRTMWRDFARSMGFPEEEFDKPASGDETPPKEDSR
jgi:hypothetical protein